MKILSPLVFVLVLLFYGCAGGPAKVKLAPETPPPPRRLLVTPAQSPVALVWGSDTAVALNVVWSDGGTQPATLAVSADNPVWLRAEIIPNLLLPPATAQLQIHSTIGVGLPGPVTLILEATSSLLDSVQHVPVPLSVRRVPGDFTSAPFTLQTQSCGSICGRVDLYGQLDFYDLQSGEVCADSVLPPDAQSISGRHLALSQRGFGFAPSCAIAAVWERSGMLSFVNLGLSIALPRGAVLASLRGGGDVWFSPDNTVAVVRFTEFLVPYDITTGRQLGMPCSAPGAVSMPVLTADSLTAGPCVWQIQ